MAITITQNLDRVRDSMINGDWFKQTGVIERNIKSLSDKYGLVPYSITRVAIGTYSLTPSDSPFGIYWACDLVAMMLRDAGFTKSQIEKWFED